MLNEISALKEVDRVRSFGGWQIRYEHQSFVLDCKMTVSVYLPPQAEEANVSHVYWLSGLTCDDQNFVTKAGAQRYAAEQGLAIIAPDTSPRGNLIHDVDAWDLGQGAGFYLNATQNPWSKNYQMANYILTELIPTINKTQPIRPEQRGIFGHSMGGHGALTLALANPDLFKSVSAFSPICSPMHCPWGEKAFKQYLGQDSNTWKQYDSCELIKEHGLPWPVLVDQGTDDSFLEEQLKPELLVDASKGQPHPIILNMRKGYDHSYHFISSFIGEHIKHHAQYL